MSWRKNLRRVTPYVPGEQPEVTDGLIKLNTNESPYPPAPEVAEALNALAKDTEPLRLYPDPDASPLNEAIAKAYGVKPSQVFTGVGSDEVLALAFLAFFNGDRPVLFPDITYSFYDVWAELYDIPFKKVPLDDSFMLRADDYKSENGGIVIANPNAPTGMYKDLPFIEDIINSNRDSVVIIDEAYIDYAGEGTSALPLIDKYDNLLVVRTTSKSRALAGMRIGYAFGSEELIKALKDIKFSFNSYTMNRVSIAVGCAAFSTGAELYYKDTTSRIMTTRRDLAHALDEMGFSYTDSAANFVFARHPEHDGRGLFSALKERGIYVRRFDNPRIDDHLRISIGTAEQNGRLVETLRELI